MNTPVCEQLFSWANKYTQVKSMNEGRFQFFWLYNLDLHNLKIENMLRLEANPFSLHRDKIVQYMRNVSCPPTNTPDGVSCENTAVVGENLAGISPKCDIPNKKKFCCNICVNWYAYYGHLVSHLKNRHDIDEQVLLTCDKCSKIFDTIKKLNRHNKIHI